MAPAHGIWVPKCEGHQAFTSKMGAIRYADYHDRPRQARSILQVPGVGATGQVVVRKSLRRSRILPFFAKLPACLVGIEACGRSHHWAHVS